MDGDEALELLLIVHRHGGFVPGGHVAELWSVRPEGEFLYDKQTGQARAVPARCEARNGNVVWVGRPSDAQLASAPHVTCKVGRALDR